MSSQPVPESCRAALLAAGLEHQQRCRCMPWGNVVSDLAYAQCGAKSGTVALPDLDIVR